MTDADLNREIAEAMGWKPHNDAITGDLTIGHPTWWCAPTCRPKQCDYPSHCLTHDLPNFLADETANAGLLEAMPLPTLEKRPYKLWACFPDGRDRSIFEVNQDRKRAICLAFLAWARTDEGKRALAERRAR